MSNAYQFEGRFPYERELPPQQAADRLLMVQLAPAMRAMVEQGIPAWVDLRRSLEGGRHWAVQLRCESATQWQELQALWAAAGAGTKWRVRSMDSYGYEDDAVRRLHWSLDDVGSRLTLSVIAAAAAPADRLGFWQQLLMKLLSAAGITVAESHFLMQFLRRHWAGVQGQALPQALNATQIERWAGLAEPDPAWPSSLAPPLATLWPQALAELLPLVPGLLRRDAQGRPTMASWARLMLLIHACHNRDGQLFEQEQRFCILGEAHWGAALDAGQRAANALQVGLAPAAAENRCVLENAAALLHS